MIAPVDRCIVLVVRNCKHHGETCITDLVVLSNSAAFQ